MSSSDGSDSEWEDKNDKQKVVRCSGGAAAAWMLCSLGIGLSAFSATHMQAGGWKPITGLIVGFMMIVFGLGAFTPKPHDGDGLREVTDYFSLFSCAGSLVGIASTFLTVFCSAHVHEGWYYIMGIVFGILLMLMGWTHQLQGHEVTEHLMNAMSEQRLASYVEALQAARPVITFKIKCYHFKTTQDPVYDDDDYMTGYETRKTSERFYTHEAEGRYPIKGFTDETMSLAQALALHHLLNETAVILGEKGRQRVAISASSSQSFLAACAFDLNFVPRDAHTADAYLQAKKAFFAQHDRDDHKETSVHFSLDMGGRKYFSSAVSTLSVGGEAQARKPCWMSHGMNMLCSFFCLGPWYQCFVMSRLRTVKWDVLKHYSALEPAKWDAPPVASLSNSSGAAAAAVARLGPALRLQHGSSDEDDSDGSSDEE